MRGIRCLLLTLGVLHSLAGAGLAGPPDPFEAFGVVRFDSGIRAPAFTLHDLNGQPVSVGSPSNPAAIVIFWATW